MRRLVVSLVDRRCITAMGQLTNRSMTMRLQSTAGLGSVDPLKSLGFTRSTPNFDLAGAAQPTAGSSSGATGEPDDFGAVETTPARNLTLADVQGPWLVLAAKLQGELFVETSGFVYYRPASNLGYGIGRMELKTTTISMVAFELNLEMYTYENVSANPPLESTTLTIAGVVSQAKAKESSYETLTLSGRVLSTSETAANVNEDVLAFNAAKLSPWDPSTAVKFVPNEEIKNGFKELFPNPVRMQSHLKRAAAAPLAKCGARHVDLSHFKVGSIDNVYYIPNYCSPAEQEQMMDQLRKTPDALKNKLTKRLAQEWGCTMCPDCGKSFVSDANLPPWTEAVSDMLLYDGIFTPTTFPNNVRIHEYEVGDGIGPHCDGPIYVPRVALLSLASTCVMSFYPRREPYEQPMEHYNDTFRFSDGDIAKERPLLSVVLEPGSLMIFEKEAYTHYPHGISDREVDSLAPEVAGEVVNRHLLSNPNIQEVKRSYRVGVTIRNLLPRCPHVPERAEFNMKRAWQLYHQNVNVGFDASAEGQGSETSKHKSETAVGTPARWESLPSSQPTTTSPAPRSSAHISDRDVAKKLDTILEQQAHMMKLIEGMQNAVTTQTEANAVFRQEVASVLNDLSTATLNLSSELDDIVDEVRSLKRDS